MSWSLQLLQNVNQYHRADIGQVGGVMGPKVKGHYTRGQGTRALVAWLELTGNLPAKRHHGSSFCSRRTSVTPSKDSQLFLGASPLMRLPWVCTGFHSRHHTIFALFFLFCFDLGSQLPTPRPTKFLGKSVLWHHLRPGQDGIRAQVAAAAGLRLPLKFPFFRAFQLG